MTDPELRDAVVSELKRKYPEPWFVEWDVFYRYEVDLQRLVTAEVRPYGTSLVSQCCRVASAQYNDLEALLAAVRALPLPPEAATLGKADGAEQRSASWLRLLANGWGANCWDDEVVLGNLREAATRLESAASMRGLLEWMDRRGGLGLDVHERIRAALLSPEGTK